MSSYEDGLTHSPAQRELTRQLKTSSTSAAEPEFSVRTRVATEPARLRSRIAGFVAVVQSVLLLGHFFVYATWIAFWGPLEPRLAVPLKVALAILSVSFVGASLLAHRFNNAAVRAVYRVAAVWLGFLNFFFLAAGASWIVYVMAAVLGQSLDRQLVAVVLYGAASLAAVAGLVNARLIRVKRIAVKLANLPASWHGRIAALVSDVHLGHVNGTAYMRRVVAKVRRAQPDVVFITGDLYDGTHVDPVSLAAPWRDFRPKFGSYFVTGNHEEFSDPTKYLDGVKRADVRVLNNEKIEIDGLQVVGVHFSSTTRENVFRAVLDRANIDPARASVLLSHAPHALEVPERAGISLQISGHTHRGQVFPFSWFTKRIFGPFTYGLARLRNLIVYTTSGVGTWGPPLRLGTNPEIVLIEFV
jgi:predicted MPP superfamily phosphohydrolase